MLKSLKLISGVSQSQTRGVKARAERLYYMIIAEIAKEEGLTDKRTELVIRSMFQKFVEQVRAGDPNGISIVNLGTFKMKPFNERRYRTKIEKLNGNKEV